MTSPSSSTSTTPRLTRGQIPATWTQPAEAVSVAPARAQRGLAPTAIVLGGIAACVVLAILLVPRAHGPARPPPVGAPSVAPPQAPIGAPRPIDEVPEPTPTASSVPTGVAPEDQGGAERPLAPAAAPTAAAPTAAPAAAPNSPPNGAPTAAPGEPAVDDANAVVTELPARKKAKGLVWRAEKMLIDGEATDAEPLLRRAAALDPTYADAWRNLGIARATLGDTNGARIAYKRYLKLAPTAPDAAEVRKILAEAAREAAAP